MPTRRCSAPSPTTSTRSRPGRAQYTHLLDPVDASVVDDIIVWWVAPEVFDVMPNASNTDGVRGALAELTGSGDLTVTDTTSTRAVIAVQGPLARDLLATVSADAAAVGRFRVAAFDFEGHRCVVAGTGYTGEDGVECAVPVEVAARFWNAVIAAGVTPAGLGARDTLRLEAALPLHGHELGQGITTLNAGLGWVVSWTKGDFRGRAALERQRDQGVTPVLRGLRIEGRRPPRAEQEVLRDGCPSVASARGTSPGARLRDRARVRRAGSRARRRRGDRRPRHAGARPRASSCRSCAKH